MSDVIPQNLASTMGGMQATLSDQVETDYIRSLLENVRSIKDPPGNEEAFQIDGGIRAG